MDCPWRRTLASVFLLLSQHNLLAVSQNVRPTGPFPPLPLLNEPWITYGGPGPGQIPQPINSLSGPTNGILPEFAPLGPFAQEHQRIPDYIGSGYPQPLPFNPVQQPNTGQFQQAPLFNSQINYLPSLQDPGYNGPQNTIVPPPHGPPLNIFPTPLIPVPQGPSFFRNVSPVGALLNNLPASAPVPEGPALNIPPTNVLPTPLVPMPQDTSFNISPPTNFCVQQGLPSNTPSHLVPVSQAPILPGLPEPIASIMGPAYNLPQVTRFPNHNTQGFPLEASSYPQPYYSSANEPCTLTTDLSSVHILPPPNLPWSIPIQNYAPVPLPIQPEVYPQSITPVKNLPNSPIYSNNHISALPLDFPANIPQLYDSTCGNFQSVAEGYNPVPINLNINVSSPTIPESKITIITAYPPAPPPAVVPMISTDSSDVPVEMFPQYPLPPIIIEGRRSRSKSWLPLFLVALFAHDGFHGSGGCGGCCCCCPCNSGCADIPIPYPIAIPTNNPIILGSSHRSRKRERVSDKKID